MASVFSVSLLNDLGLYTDSKDLSLLMPLFQAEATITVNRSSCFSFQRTVIFFNLFNSFISENVVYSEDTDFSLLFFFLFMRGVLVFLFC